MGRGAQHQMPKHPRLFREYEEEEEYEEEKEEPSYEPEPSDSDADEPPSPKSPHAKAARGHAKAAKGAKPTKPRVFWTPSMHADFCQCVQALGGCFAATPKAILDMMREGGGLTIGNVKSHLQKFRIKELKRREALAQSSASAAAAAAAAAAGLGPGGLGPGGLGGGLGGAQRGPSNLVAGGGGLPAVPEELLLGGGMVPIDATGSVSATPSPRQTPASLQAEAAAMLPMLPLQQPLPDLPFSDPVLGRQAAAWRTRQAQLLAALTAELAQHGRPPQPAVTVELQRSNLQCLQALHSLHMAQMRQHEEAVQRLQAEQHMAGMELDGGGLPSSSGPLLCIAGSLPDGPVVGRVPPPPAAQATAVATRFLPGVPAGAASAGTKRATPECVAAAGARAGPMAANVAAAPVRLFTSNVLSPRK